MTESNAVMREARIFGVTKVNEIKTSYSGKNVNEGRWTKEEHAMFVSEVLRIGIKNWKKLEEKIPSRTNCQIRSHFQKYLKKICSRYNLARSLNEIYLEGKRDKMDPTDLRILEIFNSYKRARVTFRKKKLTQTYEKRMAKKKFFKIRRQDAIKRANSLTTSTLTRPTCDEQARMEDTSEKSDPLPISSSDLFSLQQRLLDMRNINSLFLTNIQMSNCYDYDSNLFAIQMHLKKLSDFSHSS